LLLGGGGSNNFGCACGGRATHQKQLSVVYATAMAAAA